MKHVLKFASAILALVVVGCGGTGNQPPSNVTVVNGIPRVECIVKVLPTNLMHPNEWTAAQLLDPTNQAVKADLINPTVFGVQDPTNIECGEQMVFQIVYYSSDGTRNIVPGVTWSSSDASGTYGNLAANTGDFLAGSSATNSPLQVTGTYNGGQYSTFYDIKIDQVRLLGNVLAQGTNANQLAGTLLQFYNASGALVDTVTVQFDGSFRASVPTVATSFTVVPDSVPSTFYHSFNYLGNQYDAGVVTCFAPLPSGLSVGTTTLTGAVYVPPRVAGQGTPQSTGCSDGPVTHIKIK